MTLVAVAPVSVPHPAVQAAPFVVSFQATPLFVASFCTVAFTTKGLAPVFTELNLFVMATARAAVIVKASESDLFVFAIDVALSIG